MSLRIAACAILASLSLVAQAQNLWPSRPIKIVVPFPAGGPTDVLTRALSDKLSIQLGTPVVVENKPGAAGAIGSDLVAKSPADGYTLVMATGSTHSVAPYLTKVPYDPQKDFAPIVWIGNATNLLLVSPTLNLTSVKDLIELAKKNPGKLNYSTSGIGSVAHLTSEHFAKMAGIQLTHVPYKGTQQSIPDLASGQVALLFDNIVTGKPHVDSKRLKALGISSAKRSSLVPDIPTVAESGLPGFESWNWFGILAPAGTRQMVIDRLNESFNKVLQDPAIKERFVTLGFEPVGGTSAQFAEVIRSEGEKWSKVIRDANVKAE